MLRPLGRCAPLPARVGPIPPLRQQQRTRRRIKVTEKRFETALVDRGAGVPLPPLTGRWAGRLGAPSHNTAHVGTSRPSVRNSLAACWASLALGATSGASSATIGRINSANVSAVSAQDAQ